MARNDHTPETDPTPPEVLSYELIERRLANCKISAKEVTEALILANPPSLSAAAHGAKIDENQAKSDIQNIYTSLFFIKIVFPLIEGREAHSVAEGRRAELPSLISRRDLGLIYGSLCVFQVNKGTRMAIDRQYNVALTKISRSMSKSVHPSLASVVERVMGSSRLAEEMTAAVNEQTYQVMHFLGIRDEAHALSGSTSLDPHDEGRGDDRTAPAVSHWSTASSTAVGGAGASAPAAIPPATIEPPGDADEPTPPETPEDDTDPAAPRR